MWITQRASQAAGRGRHGLAGRKARRDRSSARSSRHSSRISGPPARWMAPSTPPPPSRELLAALTMASTRSSVMSPRTISMLSVIGQLRLLDSSYTFSSSAMASSRALAAFFEHLGHVRLEVVLHQELVERAERFLDGEGLREDVDAVVLVLDHLLDAPELAFEDARAVEGALLDVCDHGSRITPRFPYTPMGYMPMC